MNKTLYVTENGLARYEMSDSDRKSLQTLFRKSKIPVKVGEHIIHTIAQLFDENIGRTKIIPTKGRNKQLNDFIDFMEIDQNSKNINKIMISYARKTFTFKHVVLLDYFQSIFSRERSGSNSLNLIKSMFNNSSEFLPSRKIALLNKLLLGISDEQTPSSKFNFEFELPEKNRLGTVKGKRKVNILTYEILSTIGILKEATTGNAMNSFIAKHTKI